VPIPDRLVSMPTPFQRIKNMAQEGVPYRFVTSRGCHSKFADLGMMYGLDSGTGVHSTPVYGWIELLSLNEFGTLPTGEFLRAASEVSFCFALNHLNSPLLRLMNVGWMIAPDPDDPQSHPAAPQGDPTGRESVLVRLPEPLPRAFLVSSAFIGDVPAQAARLVDPGWKPELEATLAEEPLPAPEAGGASECRILRNEPDTMTVQTSCERPKLLVISDVFYPGWEAEVNGRSQPILRVDVALRGVPLPAGTSLVTLRYKPRSLRWGFGLTLLTALLLLCYGLWGKLQEGAM
jgi:hypothetical protein